MCFLNFVEFDEATLSHNLVKCSFKNNHQHRSHLYKKYSQIRIRWQEITNSILNYYFFQINIIGSIDFVAWLLKILRYFQKCWRLTTGHPLMIVTNNIETIGLDDGERWNIVDKLLLFNSIEKRIPSAPKYRWPKSKLLLPFSR